MREPNFCPAWPIWTGVPAVVTSLIPEKTPLADMDCPLEKGRVDLGNGEPGDAVTIGRDIDEELGEIELRSGRSLDLPDGSGRQETLGGAVGADNADPDVTGVRGALVF